MNILIVGDKLTIQFEIVTQLQNHLQIDNNNIKIANNSFEARAMAEKYDLDIIILDLQAPITDEIKDIRQLTYTHSHIKIIVLTNFQDKFLVQKIKKAGAKGYLLRDEIALNLISMLKNVSNGYIVFPDQKMFENKVYAQLNINTIIPFDNSDKILKIYKIVALETINQWAFGREKTKLTQDMFFDYFNIQLQQEAEMVDFITQESSIDYNLYKMLELKLAHLISKYLDINNLADSSTLKKLDLIIDSLNKWFYAADENDENVQLQIQSKAQILRINIFEQLKDFINSFFLQTAPITCLEYLELIEESLSKFIENYQSKLEKYKQREQSAFRAYNALISTTFGSVNEINSLNNTDTLARSISDIYQNKIKIEVFGLLVQALQGLNRILQVYIDDLLQVNNFLDTLKMQLDIDIANQDISTFVRQQVELYQDSNKLLQEIEADVGYSINQWGIQHNVTSHLILDKLMSKVSLDSDEIISSLKEKFHCSNSP
jgi:CheY-like chemotaxis protein